MKSPNERPADVQSLPPTSTVRRNPSRRAKQIPSTNAPTPFTFAAAAGTTPFAAEELFPSEPPKLPPTIPKPCEPTVTSSENLKVFLRIRPLEVRPQVPGRNPSVGVTRRRGKDGKSSKFGKLRNNVCLVVNDSSSVTLSAPPSVFDSKRTKSELYDGFSFVFPPGSLQEEVFEAVMNPIVMDFMRGKCSLLAAMGPTGSGKTHTMFGSAREPGVVPLALRRIFSHTTKSGEPQPPRSYYISMFEIYSERGKGERILDLSPNGVDLSFQQSTIKGLQESMISTAAEAESIVACGMLKRATAATSANNQSSRSQCIINIRCSVENINDASNDSPCAVLTIADLAGAEKERKTGNQGARLLESNFINNTSMVFGLCLRSLLEHQKHPKKSFEKHFKSSLLTRYLRDYLEGKKRMTLILTVKPGEDDYLDTSFLLRQASPYMKIKFNNSEDCPNVPPQKRNITSQIRIEQQKRRKFDDAEAALDDCGENEEDTHDGRQISEKGKPQDIEPQQMSNCSPKSSKSVCMCAEPIGSPHVELARMKRNAEVMGSLAKALWNVLKQYKHKLEESKYEVQSLKETLGKERSQVTELKKELKDLRSYCSCHKQCALEVTARPNCNVPLTTCAAEATIHSSKGKNYKHADAVMSNHTTVPLDPKVESFQVLKQKREELEGTIDELKLSQTTDLSELQSYPFVQAEHYHKFVLPSLEKTSHVEDTKESHSLPAEDVHRNDSCEVRNLTNGMHDPTSKPLITGKPRRRLLPASSMLLKEFNGLDMEAESAKEARGKLNAEARGRSDGSISLVRLLKSNLHL